MSEPLVAGGPGLAPIVAAVESSVGGREDVRPVRRNFQVANNGPPIEHAFASHELPSLAAVLALVDLSLPTLPPARPADARVEHIGSGWVEAQGADGGGVGVGLGGGTPWRFQTQVVPSSVDLKNAPFHAQEQDPAIRRMDRDTFDEVVVQPLVLNAPGLPAIVRNIEAADIAAQVDRLGIGIASDRLNPAPAAWADACPREVATPRSRPAYRRQRRY